MKKSRINAAVLTTAISIAAAALVAQENSSTRTDRRASDKRTETSATSSSASSTQVQSINKASKIVGMPVKNQQGEKLGKIDDMVIDLNGDKVAYCVLSVSQGAFSTDKLHAVPLRAFQASADGTYLILNADKEKLAAAQGFDKENWPSPTDSSWGAEPFWQEHGSTPSSDKPSSDKLYKNEDSRRDNTPGTETTP